MIRTRLEDSDPIKWKYHTQTEKKHQILKAYLDAWYPILGSWNDRLVVVDGFAGRATYIPRRDMAVQDCHGSPLIMLESLISHQMFKNKTLPRCKKFIFLFIEANKENHRLLENAIDEFKPRLNSMPTNVSIEIHTRNYKFEEISDNGIEEYVINAPFDNMNQATFLFVDPFGFTGFPLDLLGRLCRPSKVHRIELFLNFMIDYITRSAPSVPQQTNMTKLFGTDSAQWREFRDGTFAKDPTAVRLLDLYVKQLQSHAQFEATHVLSLEMKRENHSTIYYLIYATRHSKGVKCMKDAIWKVDPEAAKQLLTPSETLETVLVQYFREKPPRTRFKIEEIEEYVILHTNFDTTVKSALSRLEEEGSIAFLGDRLRKYSYPQGSFVTFTGKQLKISDLFGATKSSVNTKRKANELENVGEDVTKSSRSVFIMTSWLEMCYMHKRVTLIWIWNGTLFIISIHSQLQLTSRRPCCKIATSK
jgi:three-Cys-motif partner protein